MGYMWLGEKGRHAADMDNSCTSHATRTRVQAPVERATYELLKTSDRSFHLVPYPGANDTTVSRVGVSAAGTVAGKGATPPREPIFLLKA